MDWHVVLAGLIVGFAVGLTGMGGGALMTPVLILLLNVNPAAAVSSDLVASVVMKPVGGAVHLRRRTVHYGIVKWLMLGSVPTAFLGVLLLRSLPDRHLLKDRLELAIGAALLLALVGLIVRVVLAHYRPTPPAADVRQVPVRPIPTLLVGAVGGLIVGMTSVGSGSLMIVALMFLYPALTMSQLVGTDLVQAVPLVLSAAVGQVLFGEFHLALTAALVVGSVPAVYAGARVSAVAPQQFVRRALAVVLLMSALELVHVPTVGLGWALVLSVLVAFGSRLVPSLRGRRTGAPRYRRSPATERG
jgi:uncharacterized membrane protein YfcA